MILTEAKLIGSALLLAAVIAEYAWFVHSERAIGAQQCRAEVAAGVAKSQAEAAEKEGTWNESARLLKQANAADVQAIRARNDRDLARLRVRPAGSPDLPAPAGSAGSAGSVGGLSDSNRELLRLGARANEVRSALATCQAWIAKVKGQD